MLASSSFPFEGKRSLGPTFGVKDLFVFFFFLGLGEGFFFRGVSLGLVLHIFKDFFILFYFILVWGRVFFRGVSLGLVLHIIKDLFIYLFIAVRLLSFATN